MVNAFKYTKQLEEAGFSREQAEAQLQIIVEIVEGDLATKQDLEILKKDILGDLEPKFQAIENRFEQLELKLTIKLGTLMVVGVATMATLMKFWIGQ